MLYCSKILTAILVIIKSNVITVIIMIVKIVEKHYGKRIEQMIEEIESKRKESDLDKNVRYQELLKKHINQPVDIIPEASETYMQTVHICDEFARRHLGYIRAEISLAELTASIYLTFLRLNIDKRDIKSTIKAK